jgi:hypothetical protein
MTLSTINFCTVTEPMDKHNNIFLQFFLLFWPNANSRSTAIQFYGKIVSSVVKSRFYMILPDFNDFTRFYRFSSFMDDLARKAYFDS